MKFTTDKEQMVSALSSAARVSSGAKTEYRQMLLTGLRVAVSDNRLRITGSDGAISIETSMPADDCQPGEAVTHSKLTAAAVKSMPAAIVEGRLDGEKLVIAAGTAKFSLPVLRPVQHGTSFSAVPIPKTRPPATLEDPYLWAGLKQIVGAAAPTTAHNTALTGVLFDQSDIEEDGLLRIVACDMNRLSMKTINVNEPLPGPEMFNVPARAVRELLKIVHDNSDSGDPPPVIFYIGDDTASFRVEDTVVSTVLIGGSYPDYRQLAKEPGGPKARVTFDRDEMGDALKRVRLLGQDRPAELQFRTHAVTVHGGDVNTGDADDGVAATVEGSPPGQAWFHAKRLSEAVESCLGPEVRMTLQPDLEAAVRLESPESDPGFLATLPARITAGPG